MKSPVRSSDSRRDAISPRRASSPSHSLSRRAARWFGSSSTAASKSSFTRAHCSSPGRIVVLGYDFPPEPRFRHPPFSLYGPRRNIQDLADFFVRQATEEAQLDDLALARIEGEEVLERIIERDQIDAPFGGRCKHFVEGELIPAAAALFR